MPLLRTEDLVAHVVLSDEVSEKLLVDAGLVDDLRPEMLVSCSGKDFH